MDFVDRATTNYVRLSVTRPRDRQQHRQSGDWTQDGALTGDGLRQLLGEALEALDVERARREVEPFVRKPAVLQVWSREFFRDVAGRIIFV